MATSTLGFPGFTQQRSERRITEQMLDEMKDNLVFALRCVSLPIQPFVIRMVDGNTRPPQNAILMAAHTSDGGVPHRRTCVTRTPPRS